MTKRLFIAIPLPPAYLAVLGQYGENYDLSGVRWTKAENLHITAHFLGEVEESLIPALSQKLKDFFRQKKFFLLRFNKILFGPLGREPRMIWAIFFPSLEFKELAESSLKIINDFLPTVSEKPVPHITLARFKNFTDISRLKLNQLKLPDLKVSACQLMASRLLAGGPSYQIVENLEFGI